MSKLKVLCFNTGYFLGYSGKSGDYLKNPLKAIIGAKNEEAYLLEFLALVRKEDPDFILIQEIDSGSIRSSKGNQAAYISERLGEKYDFEFNVKYNNWFIRSLPISKSLGNALFYKKGVSTFHYLPSGIKSLVQEIKLQKVSIFSVHFSRFRSKIRKLQMKELRELAEKRDNFVIAGDMNAFKREKEIKELEQVLGREIIRPGKTFPACDPTEELDLIASSENITVENSNVLEESFSDHKPLTFEINQD